jgi:hypothetical protein
MGSQKKRQSVLLQTTEIRSHYPRQAALMQIAESINWIDHYELSGGTGVPGDKGRTPHGSLSAPAGIARAGLPYLPVPNRISAWWE